MDIAKFKQKCPQHPDFKIEFVQVDNLSENKKDQKLFYCTDCADQDSSFKSSNYQWIKNIIKSGTDEILSKWPPVSDNKLLSQLIEIQKGKEDTQSIELQIQNYFTDLKSDIMKQIDICQKKMIQEAQDFIQNKQQILNRYQELSKINELRSIFVDNQTDINQKERQYRVLIDNFQLQKKSITSQLATLLDQQINFTPGSALQMKESIFNSINNIQFFEYPNIQSGNKQHNQTKLDVQLLTTNWQECSNYLEVSKNEDSYYQAIVKQSNDSALNIVSNVILQNEPKYIFRMEVQMIKENDRCYIGLIQDCHINNTNGYNDRLCCRLELKNKCISHIPNNISNSGIDKNMKGIEFQLSKENVIELRICIKDQILEVLDYPNYYCKLELEDKYKSNLINLNNLNNLKLYLGMACLNNKIILKECFTVQSFE